MIEYNPGGTVPHTPTYQESLSRLYLSHQVYASADHKGGHVTVRSLAKLPPFHASNLDEVIAGQLEASALESNSAIFDRYVKSLSESQQQKAEGYRLQVVGRPVHHRKHHGAVPAGVHDPVHSLFLVPGTGPHPGLPGNYLYGSMFEVSPPDAPSHWVVQLHDVEEGSASLDVPTMAEALEKVQEALASAPFQLSELEALGFKAN